MTRPADPRRPALRRGRARRRPGPRRCRRRDRAGPCRIGVGGVGETLDADGLVLLPGLVDLHTHLREPGGEESETVATGSAAAALGGYTAVFAMPNTDPVADSAVVVEHVRRLGEEVGLVDVHPVGAVTVGLAGERMAELGTMAASARPGAGVLRRRPLRARPRRHAPGAGVRLVARRGDRPARRGPPAHRGRAGARGRRRGAARAGRVACAAEETIVARDCALAREAGARLHVCHVSSAHTIACCGRPRPPACGSPPRSPRTTCCSPTRRCATTTPCTRSTRRCARGDDTAAMRGGARRGRDRRRGHRPRPARHAVQGHRVGGRPAGHAGAADGAVGGRRAPASRRGCSTGAVSPA